MRKCETICIALFRPELELIVVQLTGMETMLELLEHQHNLTIVTGKGGIGTKLPSSNICFIYPAVYSRLY